MKYSAAKTPAQDDGPAVIYCEETKETTEPVKTPLYLVEYQRGTGWKFTTFSTIGGTLNIDTLLPISRDKQESFIECVKFAKASKAPTVHFIYRGTSPLHGTVIITRILDPREMNGEETLLIPQLQPGLVTT